MNCLFLKQEKGRAFFVPSPLTTLLSTRDSQVPHQAHQPVHPDGGHDDGGDAVLLGLHPVHPIRPVQQDAARPLLSPERHRRGCS